MNNEEVHELIQMIYNLMISHATGKGERPDQQEYARAREILFSISDIKQMLPLWIRTHRTLDAFEEYMKTQYPTYAARREAIKEHFAPIFAKLSNDYIVPVDGVLAEELNILGVEHIQSTWQRALGRIKDDPSGAITLARTLLESVCKVILEQSGVTVNKNLNLKSLFLDAWSELDKKKSQAPLDAIKTKLGDLVEEFGRLRNEFSDAHGRGISYSAPLQFEAEFAVNLSGTIALLLVKRWLE